MDCGQFQGGKKQKKINKEEFAFAIFANGGKEVIPMAIRMVEDRNGNIIFNPERDILLAQQQKGASAQIISPQTAYVMTQLLTNTVKSGTLAGQGAKLFI